MVSRNEQINLLKRKINEQIRRATIPPWVLIKKKEGCQMPLGSVASFASFTGCRGFKPYINLSETRLVCAKF